MDDGVEGVLLQVADDDTIDPAVEVGDDVSKKVVRHRTRRRDVLDLQRDGVGLEQANPDRQDAVPFLVLEDHDGRVADGVQHQSLDRHLYQHGGRSLRRIGTGSPGRIASPPRLCGPPRVTRTRRVWPIQDASPLGVSVGAAKFTTVFTMVRPDSSASWRRPTESTSTSTVLPTAASWSAVWISRCSACSATMRDVFSSGLTSSARRFDASVFGRGEYLKENMLSYRAAAVSDSVCSKSSSVSPGNPTIMSVESVTPGTASRIRPTMSRYSSRVCRRRIACSTRLEPD